MGEIEDVEPVGGAEDGEAACCRARRRRSCCRAPAARGRAACMGSARLWTMTCASVRVATSHLPSALTSRLLAPLLSVVGAAPQIGGPGVEDGGALAAGTQIAAADAAVGVGDEGGVGRGRGGEAPLIERDGIGRNTGVAQIGAGQHQRGLVAERDGGANVAGQGRDTREAQIVEIDELVGVRTCRGSRRRVRVLVNGGEAAIGEEGDRGDPVELVGGIERYFWARDRSPDQTQRTCQFRHRRRRRFARDRRREM